VIPDTITLRAIQNPFTIRETGSPAPLIDLIPQSKRSRYQNIIGNKNGVLVTVFSNRKLKPVSDKSFGKAVLYDAVGNIVNELELQNAASDTTLYGFVWDGTNSSNRLVGTGTYLMRLKVTNSAGKNKMLSEKLGVR
jgi:flagellar hook assembly protein FlgD